MPSRKIHNTIAKTLFPWIPYSKINRVNKTIDSAYLINPKKHRQILGHSLESGLALTTIEKDPDVFLLWGLHVWLDKTVKTGKYKFKFRK
jgi:hypothetical protein